MNDEPKKTFLVRYRYEGAEWAVRLPARDFDDANARLGRLAYASIDGEHVMTIPASLGPLALFVTAIRNAAYALFPRP
jgi:hypothetical protein